MSRYVGFPTFIAPNRLSTTRSSPYCANDSLVPFGRVNFAHSTGWTASLPLPRMIPASPPKKKSRRGRCQNPPSVAAGVVVGGALVVVAFMRPLRGGVNELQQP